MLRSPRACPGRQLPKYGVPTGLLYGAFYVLTALAAVAYYRRRVLASARNAVMLGVLPLGAAAFLTWVLWKSLAAAPAGQLWSVTSILAAGIIQAHERAGPTPAQLAPQPEAGGHSSALSNAATAGALTCSPAPAAAHPRHHDQEKTSR